MASLPNGTSDTPSSSIPPLKKIVFCVFCGASSGHFPAHLAAAQSLAQAMAKHNISLVYGGGSVGLMGELARTLVSLSGPESVHGIIPAALMKFERGTNSLVDEEEAKAKYEIYGRTTIVKDMHTRKDMMAKEVYAGAEGSGFVALTGGYGTLEELMEVVTWNQLGIHGRGICVYNVEGYWDGLLTWVKEGVRTGFITEKNMGIIAEARDAEEVVGKLREYKVSEGRLKLEWGQK